MSTATGPLMTADEFGQAFYGEAFVELIDGQVVRYPMPGGPHGYVVNNAAFFLTQFVRANDLGRVFGCDTFVRTRTGPDRVRGADAQFISYARLPRGPIPEGVPPCPPEVVFEVRSPTDRLSAVAAKAEEYLDAGVDVVVYLDPRNESAAIYRGDEFPQRLHNGDELTLPDVLPGFAVPVKKFFE